MLKWTICPAIPPSYLAKINFALSLRRPLSRLRTSSKKHQSKIQGFQPLLHREDSDDVTSANVVAIPVAVNTTWALPLTREKIQEIQYVTNRQTFHSVSADACEWVILF